MMAACDESGNPVRYLLIVTMLVLCILCPTAYAQTTSFAGGKVSFTPPPGFTRLSPEAAAKKYPSSPRAPDFVFANPKTTVTVQAAHVMSPGPLPPLDQFKNQMQEQLSHTAALRWIEHGYRTINGTKWIYFEVELIADEAAASRHTVTMLTFLDGGLLSYGYNAALPDLPANKAALDQSISSIRVTGAASPADR